MASMSVLKWLTVDDVTGVAAFEECVGGGLLGGDDEGGEKGRGSGLFLRL